MQLVSRLGSVFGKAPKHDMSWDDYLEYLDENMDRSSVLAAMVSGLYNLQPYRKPEAVIGHFCFGVKKNPYLEAFIESFEEDPMVFFDPALKGRRSVYLARVEDSRQAAESLISELLRSPEKGGHPKVKSGMIVTQSGLTQEMTEDGKVLVAVPALWFLTSNQENVIE